MLLHPLGSAACLGSSKRHMKLWAGRQRGPPCDDSAQSAWCYAGELATFSATCALCFSTPRATRGYVAILFCQLA